MRIHSTEKFRLISLAVAGLIAFALTSAPAYARPGVKTGTLTCEVSSGWGIVLGSSRAAECVFDPMSGNPERYEGRFSRLGVDIGYLSSAKLGWAVFAPTTDVAPGTLAGTYVGASAAISAVYGAGVNVLLGGGSSFALQPISGEHNAGFNLAAGLGSLTLSPSD